GAVPAAARRRAPFAPHGPGAHAPSALRGREGQPRLHVRDRAGPEGGVQRAAGRDLHRARRAALGDPLRRGRRRRPRGGRDGGPSREGRHRLEAPAHGGPARVRRRRRGGLRSL
ncbi:MAG: Antitoxin HigA, partial [uncultured Nocardioidaceae bacterium]